MTTCKLPDCDKPRYQRRDMCGSHFMKDYRYGDPYYKAPSRRNDLTGKTFGLLKVIKPSGLDWLCQCECGETAVVQTGTLNRGQTTCGNKTTHWRTEHVGYYQAHNRLTRDRGRASDYSCVDCGEQAYHWSYVNNSPHELVDGTKGLRYSLVPDDYEPRCPSCHWFYDND